MQEKRASFYEWEEPVTENQGTKGISKSTSVRGEVKSAGVFKKNSLQKKGKG